MLLFVDVGVHSGIKADDAAHCNSNRHVCWRRRLRLRDCVETATLGSHRILRINDGYCSWKTCVDVDGIGAHVW